ncbi:MAG: MarR family transcriptional regulator [Deltaproteobacteria bacterium]|nr:MarR family transcriptional regulator [Deltaproteobacteria bacterium]
MNNRENDSIDVLLDYQSQKLQDLIEEIVQCCKERTSFLSKKFDIPEAELRCLMLFGEERYLTAKGISQKLDVAKSRVTKIINGLVKKRLVESIDDPKDARIKLIGLTSKGQKKSRELSDFTKDLHQKLLLEFEPEQRKMVISCLEILRASMEAVKNQMV